MAGDYLTCPMCGFEFARGDTLCAHGCPLGSMCRLVRCPSCKYEFPETPAAVGLFRRIFVRRRALPVAGGETHLPETVRAASDLRPGQRATVLCVGSTASDRHRTLTVFGVVPGAELRIVQQQPACVIRVGETELALDREIAREILVEPAGKETGGPQLLPENSTSA
jgi:Fe2+ transport system protein FeoA